MHTHSERNAMILNSGLVRVTFSCFRIIALGIFLTFMPLGVTRVLLDGVGVGVLSGKLTKQNETWSIILQSDGLSFCKPLACKAGGTGSTHNGEVSCFSDVFQKKIFRNVSK